MILLASMSKRGYIEVFDSRANKKVKHKRSGPVVINQNKDNIFPEFDKVTQKHSEGNCIKLSINSILKSLRRKTKNEEWKRALDEAITETENFHEIVLPTCEGGVYVHKKGYSETAILHFVRHLSQKVFSKYGLRLKMKSRETFSYKTFFKMSSGQRKGRSFMVIGWYPSTDKNELLQKKIKEYLSDKRTAAKIYKKLPDNFWVPINRFSLHAIALCYDNEGRGYIDDPGHRSYHPVTPAHFFRSCACIGSVYEFRVENL